jgi:ADP-ribose pyrophosphatase
MQEPAKQAASPEGVARLRRSFFLFVTLPYNNPAQQPDRERHDRMAAHRRVEIRKQTRVFDDFFKIDEIVVAHERQDGTLSADEHRLIFERGDAAAVLLLNLDRNAVVLLEQFRAPTLIGRRRDNATTTDGWIVEPIAGIVEANETPAATAIRECMEETGYRIGEPEPIATFFSSPGGTSERIFLYFAAVHDADRVGKGGGVDDEDIRLLDLPLPELFQRVAYGAIDDPKLMIAAYWLQERLRQKT